jgi:hypothetical protein
MTPAEIAAASFDWPRSIDTRHSRGRVACPECGASGWPGGTWTHAHRFHDTCDDCGGRFSTRGLATHRAQMRRYFGTHKEVT